MQIILDFMNTLYQNGNVSFHFKNEDKIEEFCICLKENKDLEVMRNVYLDGECINQYHSVSLQLILSCLMNFSVLKKSIFEQREFIIDSDINIDTPKQELWGINVIYKYLEEMMNKAVLDKNTLIQSCFGTEKNFFDYLCSLLPKDFHVTLSNVLDNKTLEILFRKQFSDFSRSLFEGLHLYSEFIHSDSTNHEKCLKNWYGYIGKDKEEENISLLEKTKIKHMNITYDFLDELTYRENPAVGRDEELKQLCLSLLTLTKSPIIVGPSGVGKTALVEGIGYLIQKRKVPTCLQDKKIMRVSVSSLVSGCQYVGSFEKKIGMLMEFLQENTNIILFLDEIHTAVGAGASNKSDLDLANILKPYLDRGQIKIIGSTTNEEYDQYIGNDLAFRRRFEKINLSEPGESVLKQIINSYMIKLSTLTQVFYPFDGRINEQIISILIEATENKNRVYNDKRNNPDLVLSILEKAFAYAQYNNASILSIEHLSKAIEMCDVLYLDNRKRLAKKMYSLSDVKEIVRCKVINFPKI